MPFVTLLAAGLAAVVATIGSPPHYVYRDVAFVTLTGHGTVTSTPRGIDCPAVCRGVFVRGTHLRLDAKPAPGWRLVSIGSRWCPRSGSSCAFDLVSPHDCVGGACPVGAYGVRVLFRKE